MSTDFTRRVDSMLRSAERVLLHGPAAAPQPAQGGGALQTVPVNSYRRAADPNGLMDDPVPFMAATVGGMDTNGCQPQQAPSSGQAGAVQWCMAEIAELKRQLQSERENRDNVALLLSRRIRDEVRAEMEQRLREHELKVRDVEDATKRRFADADIHHAAMTKRVEDVTRAFKVQSQEQFALEERTQGALSEMKSLVDAAYALGTTARVEGAREAEKERMAMQHRLNMELMRLAEVDRQHHLAVESAKERLRQEVADVSRTVERVVAAAWDDRARALTASVADALNGFREASRTHAAAAADASTKVDKLQRHVQQLQQLDAATLQERLTALEAAGPVLLSRTERVERRAEALLESNSRLGAGVDTLREAADRATAHATRALERMHTLEGTMADRDARLAATEASLLASQGAESLRADVEGAKRAVARLEAVVDGVRGGVQRDERLLEQLQRQGDQAAERTEGIESKAQRAVARADAVESRLAGALERLATVEAAAERQTATGDRLSAEVEALKATAERRGESAEQRATAAVVRLESNAKEAAERLTVLAAALEALQEANEGGSQGLANVRAEMERLSKRVLKAESSSAAATEDANAAKDELRTVTTDLDQQKRRVDSQREALDRVAAAAAAATAAADAAAANAATAATSSAAALAASQQQQQQVAAAVAAAAASAGGAGDRATAEAAAMAARAASDALSSQVAALRATVESQQAAMATLRSRLDAVEVSASRATTSQESVTSNTTFETRRLREDLDSLEHRVDSTTRRVEDVDRRLQQQGLQVQELAARPVGATAAATAASPLPPRPQPVAMQPQRFVGVGGVVSASATAASPTFSVASSSDDDTASMGGTGGFFATGTTGKTTTTATSAAVPAPAVVSTSTAAAAATAGINPMGRSSSSGATTSEAAVTPAKGTTSAFAAPMTFAQESPASAARHGYDEDLEEEELPDESTNVVRQRPATTGTPIVTPPRPTATAAAAVPKSTTWDSSPETIGETSPARSAAVPERPAPAASAPAPAFAAPVQYAHQTDHYDDDLEEEVLEEVVEHTSQPKPFHAESPDVSPQHAATRPAVAQGSLAYRSSSGGSGSTTASAPAQAVVAARPVARNFDDEDDDEGELAPAAAAADKQVITTTTAAPSWLDNDSPVKPSLASAPSASVTTHATATAPAPAVSTTRALASRIANIGKESSDGSDGYGEEDFETVEVADEAPKPRSSAPPAVAAPPVGQAKRSSWDDSDDEF